VKTTAVGGTGFGWASGGRFPSTVINVTMIVPTTPMSAAVMVGSSRFEDSLFDIIAPVSSPMAELWIWEF
jgi:hypothetical protein